jgi:hypothetical protein
MYRAKWDRNDVSSRSRLSGGEDGLLGILDFEESKRNIVFRPVKRTGLEEEEERGSGRKDLEAAKERKKLGYWLKKVLARNRHASV